MLALAALFSIAVWHASNIVCIFPATVYAAVKAGLTLFSSTAPTLLRYFNGVYGSTFLSILTNFSLLNSNMSSTMLFIFYTL